MCINGEIEIELKDRYYLTSINIPLNHIRNSENFQHQQHTHSQSMDGSKRIINLIHD